MNTLTPPSYPARPVNGGPLPKARRKRGAWAYEPKVNGWRAWLHVPTGQMFNRQNEPLSIAGEFSKTAKELRERFVGMDGDAFVFEWLDVEAFERRHNLGRGSLVILDVPLPAADYLARQQSIYSLLVAPGRARSWPFLHEPPPENSLLSFAYSFTDYGIASPASEEWQSDEGHYRGEDVDGIHTGWRLLQAANQTLGAEVFEGLVAKRVDSLYPVQLRSPDEEFPGWMKHRWAY